MEFLLQHLLFHLRGTASTIRIPPILHPSMSHPSMSLHKQSLNFLHPPIFPCEDEAIFATYVHPPRTLHDFPLFLFNLPQFQHQLTVMTKTEYGKHDQQPNSACKLQAAVRDQCCFPFHPPKFLIYNLSTLPAAVYTPYAHRPQDQPPFIALSPAFPIPIPDP